jgi:uncharacterized protein YutE (UPF0331/DUF86 family)
MNEAIKRRIGEKLETIVERVEFIEGNIVGDILGDRILRKAIYKEYHEAIEAMTDVCAMVRRGLNSSAQDDYSNIEFLIEKGIVDERLGEKLKEANGLRNRLIHGYNGVDDKTACAVISDLVAILRDFSVVVLEWIGD